MNQACTKCGISKSSDEFWASGKGDGRKRAACVTCCKARNKGRGEMGWGQTLMTCRFCKEHGYDSAKFVKYGVRHYAHHACYLKAGKKLDDLHAWQVGLFPYRLLKEHGLDGEAANIVGAMRHHGRQP